MYTAKIPKPLWLRDFTFCTKAINLLFHCSVSPPVNPAKRFAGESEEKVRPAYEKALRPFHRLRAFSELPSPNTIDTALRKPCGARDCRIGGWGSGFNRSGFHKRPIGVANPRCNSVPSLAYYFMDCLDQRIVKDVVADPGLRVNIGYQDEFARIRIPYSSDSLFPFKALVGEAVFAEV